MTDPFLSRAQGMREDLVALRRDLHRHPELSWHEERTAATGRRWLEGLGLRVESGVGGTHGVVGQLETGRPGPTVLIRGDMDALPIDEHTGADYASEQTGVMHACGHDAHTACALGAARLLAEHTDGLAGRYRILLQPAEETPPGGAQALLDAGVLEGVDAAVALHCHPGIDVGTLGFREGQMLAHSDRFELTIRGVGGHGARPHLTVDAVAVAVQVYQALQYLVSRENDPLHPFVITVGSVHAGRASNVIADTATLTGTTRCLDDSLASELPEKMERVIAGVCRATRAEYDFRFIRGYPALVCNVPLTHQAMHSARRLVGAERVLHIPTAEMGGEDFAYISQRVPAVFFRLGVRNEARGLTHALHSPLFDLDEDALPLGAAALARIAADIAAGTVPEQVSVAE